MNILLALIPISLVLLGIAVAAFVWAVKRGQFDDMEGPAHAILMDDDKPKSEAKTAKPEGEDPENPSP